MKIPLTISVNYCNNWGLWEAVREIVQNALDSHDLGNQMKITHHGETLRVSNDGVKLDARVWLMGTTSKDAGNQRGQFGEGLKLGVLAAVRAGHDVKIVNDNESWSPVLEESEAFPGESVLTIYTHARTNASGKFTVEIGGVSKEAWEEMKPKFLFLAKPKQVESTYVADVILDPAFRGKIFVKGILVETNPAVAFGYDLKSARVDRDRRMVDSYDSKSAMSRAWQEVGTRNADRMIDVVAMLEGAREDVEMMKYSVSDSMATRLVDAFFEKYGADALPVQTMTHAHEAEHFGKRGVVLPEAFVAVLENKMGGIAKVRRDLAKAVKATFSPSDLTANERAVLGEALALIGVAAEQLGYKPVAPRVNIVEFVTEGLEGLHDSKTGDVQLSRRVLSSLEDAIGVLAHEIAHDKGADGEKAHESAERHLLTRTITNAIALPR